MVRVVPTREPDPLPLIIATWRGVQGVRVRSSWKVLWAGWGWAELARGRGCITCTEGAESGGREGSSACGGWVRW